MRAAGAILALAMPMLAACGGTRETDGGTGGTSSSTGSNAACQHLVSGPVTPVPVRDGLTNTSDISFDGMGHFAAQVDMSLAVFSADGTSQHLGDFVSSLALSYLPDGSLLVLGADNDTQGLVRRASDGTTQVWGSGVGQAHSISVDRSGRAFLDQVGSLVTVSPDGTETTALDDQHEPSSAVVDDSRNVVFSTGVGLHDPAPLFRTPKGGGETVTVVPALRDPETGANVVTESLALDVCGNLYVADAGGTVLRLAIDANGNALGGPEVLARFNGSVLDVEFGRGPGFDPTTLFVLVDTKLVGLPLGVSGAR